MKRFSSLALHFSPAASRLPPLCPLLFVSKKTNKQETTPNDHVQCNVKQRQPQQTIPKDTDDDSYNQQPKASKATTTDERRRKSNIMKLEIGTQSDHSRMCTGLLLCVCSSICLAVCVSAGMSVCVLVASCCVPVVRFTGGRSMLCPIRKIVISPAQKKSPRVMNCDLQIISATDNFCI